MTEIKLLFICYLNKKQDVLQQSLIFHFFSKEHELKSAENTINPEELKKEIQNMNQEKKTLEEKFNKLE